MIKITQDLIEHSLTKDAAYYINECISTIKDGEEIQFDPGVYRLRTELAVERVCYISNNDASIKKIGIYLKGKKNITINGNGCRLSCVGRILPIYIEDCCNIVIENFMIDYERPMFTQGEIVASDSSSVTLKIDKKLYPYEIKNHLVTFTGEDYSNGYAHGGLEFLKKEKRPAPDTLGDGPWNAVIGEETEDGLLKIFFPFKRPPRMGNLYVIKHEQRYVPGIAISCCEGITLENVTIFHAGTMGIVAQYTKDITLDSVQVKLEEGSDRAVSANADATHFVCCRGTLLIQNSTFKNQLDDGINVHGNYFKVAKVYDERTILIELAHGQQVGTFYVKDQSTFTVWDSASLTIKGELVMDRKEVINSRFCLLHLKEPFAFEQGIDYSLDEKEGHPKIIIRNNSYGSNRARPILLSSNKEMIVEDNDIDGEGSAIRLGAEAFLWYESGPISKITIQRNKISRHNIVGWGVGLIDVAPAIKRLEDDQYFDKEVVIKENEVILGEYPLVYARSLENLVICNNKLYVSKVPNDRKLPLDVQNCGNVNEAGNTYQLIK